ncbi:MAG: ROK family protein [Pedococcus sp.]
MVEVVAAVDVGGTRVKAALVDSRGVEVESRTVPTVAGASREGVLVSQVGDLVRDLCETASEPVELRACGVVVPGLVDGATGVARWSANLGWRDLPVAEPLSEVLNLPVVLGHDVRAGLVAEVRWGAATGARNVLFLPVGTGIAGALMLDGRVVLADGWAGELGHVVVEPGGPPCGCGARGCLEAVASAAAIERAYAARSASGAARVGADRIAALVDAGDPVATEVWGVAVEALARAIMITVTLTGVERVLVGGGLAQSGETLLAPLRTSVEFQLTFQRPPTIERARLGERAGCLGAAALAWDLS